MIRLIILRTASRLVDVGQRRPQRVTTVDRRALITTTRSQTVISLSETVDQFLGRTLQIAVVRLRHTEIRAVRKNGLTVVLAITTFRREPN